MSAWRTESPSRMSKREREASIFVDLVSWRIWHVFHHVTAKTRKSPAMAQLCCTMETIHPNMRWRTGQRNEIHTTAGNLLSVEARAVKGTSLLVVFVFREYWGIIAPCQRRWQCGIRKLGREILMHAWHVNIVWTRELQLKGRRKKLTTLMQKGMIASEKTNKPSQSLCPEIANARRAARTCVNVLSITAQWSCITRLDNSLADDNSPMRINVSSKIPKTTQLKHSRFSKTRSRQSKKCGLPLHSTHEHVKFKIGHMDVQIFYAILFRRLTELRFGGWSWGIGWEYTTMLHPSICVSKWGGIHEARRGGIRKIPRLWWGKVTST